MKGDLPRGIRAATDAADSDFMRFFSIVQDAAQGLGKTFFLSCAEAHDGAVGDIWCEDLSG